MGKRNPEPHRTTIPSVYRRNLGIRIKTAILLSDGEITAFAVRILQSHGVTRRSLDSYLNGQRTPSITDLRSIAQACNVTMEHLMQDVPNPKAF